MKIKSEENNIRLDKYLSDHTDYSRALISKMVNDNYIVVNGKKEKNSYLVCIDDEIEIKDGYVQNTDLKGENIKLDIVYEDNDLMVINKPSGLVVHPGNGNMEHTLVNGLINYTSNLSSVDEVRPGIVHRIDKDTSGLLIVAKNNKSHELLSDMLSKKEIHRDYLALLKGEFKYDTADVDAPIGRDSNNRQKMTVTDHNSKKAVTHLKVLTRYNGYTLVRLSLETGRTHQIRVHMNYIGYPVYNDPVYTNDKCTDFGQFLHSYYLSFVHPITKEKMEFTCDIPKEFSDFISKLEIKDNSK